jgi:hypothetical protein
MSTIHVGDLGTELLVNTGTALAGATTVEILVFKPGGTASVAWTGTVVDSTWIRYRVVSGDLSVAGAYRCQAHVHLPTWSGLGEVFTFRVYEAFT